MVSRLAQDRWTGPEGQTRSKIEIVTEHVEFKPQLKGKDDDAKDGEEKTAEGSAGPAADAPVPVDAELKEAAGF